MAQPMIKCDGRCGQRYPADQITTYREGRGTGHSESMHYCARCDPRRPDFGPAGNKIFGMG